jgi:hypothetical protein
MQCMTDLHRRLILGWLFALVCAATAGAQGKYNGPRPDTPDVPYLLHATKLLATETGEATQTEEKKSTRYTVAGATSPVRTPVSEPIFIFQSEKINPDKLSCFKMTVTGGSRTLVIPNAPGKDSPKPVYLMVTALDRGLFKVEVNEPLERGEYCLSPDGTNTVFCFTLY